MRWIAGTMLALMVAGAPVALAQSSGYATRPAPSQRAQEFSADEIVAAGHKFFGTATKGLAKAIEDLFKAHGRPTGYVLGEEASGAFVAGLRYGEGWLYMKDGRRQKIYWQGPTIGLDAGGNGTKVLMLVYDIDTPRAIFGRFPGVSGSAYLVGGFSVSIHADEHITIIPVRSGVGARLGGNVGYLKITPRPTWNPF
jgi:hypothetical protein